MPCRKKTSNELLTMKNLFLEEFYYQYTLMREQLLEILPKKAIKEQLKIIHEMFYALFLLVVLQQKKTAISPSKTNSRLSEFFTNISTIKALLQKLQQLLRQELSLSSKMRVLLADKLKQPHLGFLFFPTLMTLELSEERLSSTVLSEILSFVEQYSQESMAKLQMSLSVIFERDLMLLKKGNAITKIDVLLNKRRNMGAYYTPPMLADYMSEKAIAYYLSNNLKQIINSLDDLLSGSRELQQKALELLRAVKILDPAVGAGEFLLSSAKILYKWQRKLQQHLQQKSSSKKLRSDIITNNLFGVDLLEEALSLTNLRLFLWFLDEVLDESSEKQSFTEGFSGAQLYQGNSLFGSTETNGHRSREQLEKEHLNRVKKGLKKSSLSREAYLALQPFHWGFSCAKVLRVGGFDIILGNPPYLECKKMRNFLEKEIYTQMYHSAYKLYDISVLFLERGLQLLKAGGVLVYLITNKFLSTDFGIRIRELLLAKTSIKLLVDVSYLPLFQKTATYPIIIAVENSPPEKKGGERKIAIIPRLSRMMDLLEPTKETTLWYAQKDYTKLPGKQFVLSEDFKHIQGFFEDEMQQVVFLGEEFQIYYRLLGFINWAKKLTHLSQNKTSKQDLHFIGTANIFPFAVNPLKDLTLAKKRYKNHFLQYSPEFTEAWGIFSQPKILIKEVAHKLMAAYDPGTFASITGVYLLLPNDGQLCKYYLALLNSKVVYFIYSSLFNNIHLAGGFLRFNGSYLKQIPLIRADDNIAVKKLLINLADYLIFLNYCQFLKITPERSSLSERTLILLFQKILDYVVYEHYFRKNTGFKLHVNELLQLIEPLQLENSLLKKIIEKREQRNEKAIKVHYATIEVVFQAITNSNVLTTIEERIAKDTVLQRILDR